MNLDTSCTISKKNKDGWKTYKTQISYKNDLVRISCPKGCEIESDERIGVSFRKGHKKCLFSGIVFKRDDQYIELSIPDQITYVPRKAYDRRDISDRQVPIQLWLGDERTKFGKLLRGRIQDISVGGARIKIQVDPGVKEGDCIGCSFSPRLSPLAVVQSTINGIVREVCIDPRGGFFVSIQFVGFENSQEGLNTLDYLRYNLMSIRNFCEKEHNYVRKIYR